MPIMKGKQLLLVFLFGAYALLQASANIYETDDAVIIEAADDESLDSDLPESRSKRHVNFVARDISHTPVTTWGNTFGEGGTCITSKANFGKCMSFKNCYPYFKKIPDLSMFDSWMLGQYDTCTYYSNEGHQTFGVCCDKVPNMENKNPSIVHAESAVPSNKDGVWPPPFITHPPNHYAPTHPPTNGVRPGSTTKKPVYQWPPPLPTHPPSSLPPSLPTLPTQATTKYPVHQDTGGFCGTKNGNQDQERIVGGQTAAPNEWPWAVALFNGQRQFCGGSLIDSSHILTAAHCIAHMTSQDVARMKVHLGDHNIRLVGEVPHIEKKIKRVVRHRGFDPRTLYNDVALLTMDTPIQYSETVHPVCLPRDNRQFGGMYGTVIGWGSIRENGPQPAVLQKVTVPIWSNAQCRAKYGSAAPGGIVDHMLCAGQTAHDSCSGDSGGPLMVSDGNSWSQIGVVSWGIGCGQDRYPGVYARVTSFLPWIEKNKLIG